MSPQEPVSDPAALFEAARARLRGAGAPQEALGRLIEPRGLLGLARGPRIVREGAAWRLGVLLLRDSADSGGRGGGGSSRPGARVLATGEVVRAADPGRRGYAAESARARAELRAAARRGGFADGEVVHIGWHPLDLDAVARGEASAPLSRAGEQIVVRWSTAGGVMPLEAYLTERIGLLLEPPPGA